MKNFLITIILLIITFFVINLFPMGKNFIGSVVDAFNQKKTNVVREYDRLKEEVEDVSKTVQETKETIDKTVEAVSDAANTASKALDQVNQLLDNDQPSDSAQKDQVIKEDKTKEAVTSGESTDSSEKSINQTE